MKTYTNFDAAARVYESMCDRQREEDEAEEQEEEEQDSSPISNRETSNE